VANPTYENLNLLAAKYSDGLIQATENIHDSFKNYAEENSIPFLDFPGNDGYLTAIDEFYDNILEGNSVLVD